MKRIKEIIELLKYSKLPTILLVSILLYASYFFVKGEDNLDNPSVIIGFIFALTAIFFAIFSYADYRAREKIDHIISKYEKALNNISKTHTNFEQGQRKDFSEMKGTISSNRKGENYDTVDDDLTGTLDNF